MAQAAKALNNEINETLVNWGRWCRGGWPPLMFTPPPTSRDYRPVDQREKRHSAVVVDAVSGEAANLAIANLALHGDTRAYQIIAAWWAHHRTAKQISIDLHCSLATVYNHRLMAMARFWAEYQTVRSQNRKRAGEPLTI